MCQRGGGERRGEGRRRDRERVGAGERASRGVERDGEKGMAERGRERK